MASLRAGEGTKPHVVILIRSSTELSDYILFRKINDPVCITIL